MSDKEFCSDAHRESFADEQQLAMRRLAEAQPALQKTQRMPAVRPVAAPAPHVPASAAGGNMVIFGESLPFEPDPIAPAGTGAGPAASVDPLPRPAAILFLDRDHRLVAKCSAADSPVPVVAPAPSRPAAGAAAKPHRFSVRIVLPRGMDGSLLIPAGWPAPTGCRQRPAHRPATAIGFRQPLFPDGYLAWMDPRFSGVPLARSGASPCQLPGNVQPVPVPSAASGRTPVPAARRCRPLAVAADLRFPASLLVPVAHAQARVADPDAGSALWEALELAGLCSLASAVGYATVRAAAPVPASALVLAAPGQQTPPPTISCVAVSALSVHALACPENPIPLQDPSDLPAAGPPCPLAPPARPYLEPQIPELLPLLDAAMRAGSLPEPAAIPVKPPDLAIGPMRRTPRAAWISHSPRTNASFVPRRAEFLLLGLLPGSDVTLPLAAPQLSPGVCSQAGRKAVWCAFSVPAVLPAPLAELQTRRLRIHGRVAVDLRPDPAALITGRIHVSSLPPTLRVVLATRQTRLVAAQPLANSVPLSRLAPASRPALPSVTPAVDLIPAPAIVPAALSVAAVGPGRLPGRLFAVPNAMPMARHTAGLPAVFPIGEWGGRPAVCPSRLSADDGKPRSRVAAVRNFGRSLRDRLSFSGWRRTWSTSRNIPSDLKWIAMVIPLVLGIWILSRSGDPAPVPTAPAEEVATADVSADPVAPATGGKSRQRSRESSIDESHASVSIPVAAVSGAATGGTPQTAAPGAWDVLRSRLASRASVHLVEDFRSGLSQWEGRGEWARSWSYDRSGTVRPGQLALFLPTVGLKDYVMDLNASIDRRSIQWVVRAADSQNYQVARLNVTPGASLAYLELERWTVINGRTGRVTRLPLPHGAANQSLYAIRVEVRGDSITTYLNDQVIDTYSDSRLPVGGVGLLATGDDRPRIYGIRISHQDDFLGKLCSFLAPPPIVSQGSD
jgi:hypothetical protein